MRKSQAHLYLTTTGRKTGRSREIEIWFTERSGRYYLIAEHGRRAHWVRNLIAEPAVRVRVGRRRLAARARIVDGRRDAGLRRTVRALSERKYGWGDGLVVELAPTPGARGGQSTTKGMVTAPSGSPVRASTRSNAKSSGPARRRSGSK